MTKTKKMKSRKSGEMFAAFSALRYLAALPPYRTAPPPARALQQHLVRFRRHWQRYRVAFALRSLRLLRAAPRRLLASLASCAYAHNALAALIAPRRGAGDRRVCCSIIRNDSVMIIMKRKASKGVKLSEAAWRRRIEQSMAKNEKLTAA
jgi:hypothetical protein